MIQKTKCKISCVEWLQCRKNCRLYLEQFRGPLSKAQSDLKVGVLIFSPLKDRVLLVKRSERVSHRNIWECPGGAVEQSDKSNVHVAVHGCREKTQLHISAFLDAMQDKWPKGNRQVRKSDLRIIS